MQIEIVKKSLFWLISALLSGGPVLAQDKNGIAQQYSMDGNITDHPEVLYATLFPNDLWYDRDVEACKVYFLAEAEFKKPFFSSAHSLFHDGTGALELRQFEGDNGPQPLRIVLPEKFQDLPVYYLRWYQKFDSAYIFNHQKGTRLGGRNDGDRMNPGCGYSGGKKYMSWSVNLMPNGGDPHYWARAYYYHNNGQNCGTDSKEPKNIRLAILLGNSVSRFDDFKFISNEGF